VTGAGPPPFGAGPASSDDELRTAIVTPTSAPTPTSVIPAIASRLMPRFLARFGERGAAAVPLFASRPGIIAVMPPFGLAAGDAGASSPPGAVGPGRAGRSSSSGSIARVASPRGGSGASASASGGHVGATRSPAPPPWFAEPSPSMIVPAAPALTSTGGMRGDEPASAFGGGPPSDGAPGASRRASSA
jgi:hypothetical protein